MSFTVHTSNRMEMLARQLGEVIARPLSSPLSSEVIVVQSRGMQRWLAMELAQRFGVWANCSWPFPNKFVWDIFAATMPTLPASEPFLPASMTWRILRLVDRYSDRSEFAEIRRYLAGANAELKRYQLACRIADTFDQYTLFRGELLADWEAGKEGGWQAVLWRALAAETDGLHRGRVKDAFLRRLATGQLDTGLLPERIAVFGISYLPAFHLQVLAGLAACIEVNLFIMSPCQEYWGDILPGRVSARLPAATRDKVDEGNPLLASLGRLGRDFSNLLLECGSPVGSETDLYCQAADDSLLARVQNDILKLRPAAADSRLVGSDDTSLSFHSCHSAMREIEVLHDNLLQLLDRDRELQPRDIVVMTPDIETYAPCIAAVFDSGAAPQQRIPYSIADRSIGSNGRLAATLFAILDLVGQRFSAPAVMDILGATAVHGRFGLSDADLDLVRTWLEETAIRWGMDEQDRLLAGLAPYRENSWLAGLERLLLGYAMPDEDNLLFAGILPYDNMEGSDPVVLGRLVAFVSALHRTVTRLGSSHSLAAWGELLLSLFAEFFAPGEDEAREAATIGKTLATLAELQAATAFTAAVGLPTVRSWLLEQLAGADQGLGFLSGGVTFCAMLPMRSIPFKVIALIGMNDGVFPRQNRPPGFDLISRSPRPGDRSLRNEDRYLFLEALLSARQRLYISYCGQSISDNSPVPPSTLVSELLDYLERHYLSVRGELRRQLVTAHRLQPFSPDYFNGTAGLQSYSRENYLAVVSRLTVPPLAADFFSGPLPEAPAEMRSVRLADFLSFYNNPAAFLLRRRLGLYLEEPASPLEEREVFTIKGLEGYGLKQQLLERLVAGGSAAELFPVVRAAGLLPPGQYGEQVYTRLAAGVEELAMLVRAAGGAAAGLEPLDFDLPCGSFRLSGRLEGLLPDQLLRYRCAKLGAKDQIRLWLEHLLLNTLAADGYPCTSRLYMSDASVTLPPFAASGDRLQQLLEIYWEGLHTPLKFFPAASLAYMKSGRIEDALRVWNNRLCQESADRYYRRCFGEKSPFDAEFVRIAEAVCVDYLRLAEVQS